MQTAEARAAPNWLLLCESAGCNIVKQQECVEQLVAPSATRNKFFFFPKKSSQHQTALLFALKVVSLFSKFLFLFRVTFAKTFSDTNCETKVSYMRFPFLGAFVILRKAIISFVQVHPFVCPSVTMKQLGSH